MKKSHSVETVRPILPQVLFWGGLVLLLPVMVLLSRDFGISWDEGQLNAYGELLFSFYTNGFDLHPILSYYNVAQYGGVVELLAACAQKVFSGTDPFVVRHALVACFGWLGLVFAGLLGKRLFGVWGGILSILLLVLSPRYLAHSMINSKDLPFAVFYLGSIYAFTFLRSGFPYFSKKSLCPCILLPALAINIRVGGLLLICYALLFVAMHVWFDRKNLTSKRLGLLVSGCLAYVLVTMVLGTVFWPWALVNPLIRPIQGLLAMSRFSTGAEGEIQYALFGGQMISTFNLPWDFIPRWIAITMPLAVLAALPFFALLLVRNKKWLRVGMVAFAAFFPVAYIVVTHPRLYDDWRHVLFAYPPMVVLAAGVWVLAFRRVRSRSVFGRIVVPALLVLGLYHPLLFNINEHPNQLVYFNQLVGGTKGAFLRYDLDYWGNSYKQAVDWLRSRYGTPEKPVTFIANMAAHVPQLYANRFPNVTFQFAQAPPDYILGLLRGDPATLMAILRDPDIVHVIEADGAPLCVIGRFPKELMQ